MNVLATIILVYGVFIGIGGVMGYLKAKSKASLLTGGLSGLLIILSGILTLLGHRAGPIAAAILTLALSVFFGYKLQTAYKSKSSITRPLIIVVVSLIVLACLWCLTCPSCAVK